MNYHNSHHTNLGFHIYAASDDDDVYDDIHDGDVKKFVDDDYHDYEAHAWWW